MSSWSLTMYDERQFFVDNPIDRSAIGDRDALQPNADGSLDLLIQRQSPLSDSNWLPAPTGSFNLMLRMYWPKPEALDNTWKPPAVERTDKTVGTHTGRRYDVRAVSRRSRTTGSGESRAEPGDGVPDELDADDE